uniref:proteasome endopeptidase complex n=1 Tax=Setaria digitata TaxID=48799 RepID=A0A915PKP8_9BILA
MVVCRSGSAADTQAISDIVKYYIEVYSMMEEENVSVGRSAQIFRNFLYKYRDSLSASVLVAGYDDGEGGQLYAIPLGGYVTRQRCAASGSGSTFVQGFLDSQWKPGMNVEKCKEIVLNAVALATIRDGSSGGVIRLAVIDKTGTHRMANLNHFFFSKFQLVRPDQNQFPKKLAVPKAVVMYFVAVVLLIIFGAKAFLDEENVLPDLAPHIDNPLEFDFIEDPHKKQYLKSLFIESFYEPNCDNKSNITIKPIYFWPGQRVDLRCVMCRRAFTFNGLMKHWWFMPAKDNLKNSPKWNQHLLTLSADYGDNRWRDFGAMPSGFDTGTNPRAQTVLIQRNGMLILLQPTSENEGLYRCLDIASRNVLHFIYYLIAMQPLFIYLKPGGEEQTYQIDSRGFPDSNWKFRHIPPTYIRDPFRMCTMNWSICLDWIVSDNNMKEEINWNLHGRSRDAELAKKFVNLKIQLQWSEWSSCEQGTTVRSREGHCYLRKINPEKGIGQLVDGIFGAYDLFNWVTKLKNHMSRISEFNTTGIRLYSGLLSKLIHEGALGSDKTYDDCYTMEDSFFKNPKAARRWITAIFSAFGIDEVESMLKTSDRLCLYYYNKPTIRTDETPASVIVGTHLVDTQRCPIL